MNISRQNEMKTTLNKIREQDPCSESWTKLLKSLGKTEADNTEVSIEYILDLLGLDDAVWALCAVEGNDKEMRLMAADFAESVLNIYEKECPNDDRPRKAIGAAIDYANGKIGKDKLDAAMSAARYAAWYAARSAADAAWYAAMSAADAAGYAARYAAGYAADAARSAAADDAWSAELKKQEQILRRYLNKTK